MVAGNLTVGVHCLNDAISSLVCCVGQMVWSMFNYGVVCSIVYMPGNMQAVTTALASLQPVKHHSLVYG